MKRDINDVREIHIIPYCHTDYAWCNIRSWHICRYIASYERMLEKMRENPEYTGTLDNIVHSLAVFLRYRPELADELRQRVREGRITVANGGWSLARPSQVGEETYLRNMMASDEKFRSLFGEDLEINCLFNADTSCGHPQLPQIIRLMGYDSYCFQRPETYLNKKNIPKEFVWEGIDGSKVTVSRGVYGGLFMGEYLERPPTAESWGEVTADYNTYELEEHLNLLPSPVLVQFLGCDDTLPDHNIRDRRIYVDEFIEQWNKNEKSRMFYSTINRMFDALKKEALPVVRGDIDPFDLTYNIPKKGKNSFWSARYEGERLLTEVEAAAVIAVSYGIPYPHKEITALWKSLFEFTGHAMEFILREDIPDLKETITSTLSSAAGLLRKLYQAITDAVCGMEENAYAVINTTGCKLRQTVKIAITDTKGIFDFTLEDEKNNPVLFAVVDYTGGDKPYEDAKYSSCIVAADVTVPPYSVKKLHVVKTGKCRDYLTSEERSVMLTAPKSERSDDRNFILRAGEVEYIFEDFSLMEIRRDGRKIRTGKPLFELCFNATAPSNTWLFNTKIIARHPFRPESALRLTDNHVYHARKLTGRMNEQKVELTLTAGVDGILNLEVDFDGYYQDGYYSIEFDADAHRLCCDTPFGVRKLDFTGITSEDPMYDDWGEVSMRGGFQAKSYVTFSAGDRLTAFGVNTGSYWKYDLEENRVCCILTAQYDIDRDVMLDTANRWERFMDRDEFGCRGAHRFHAALLPFTEDTAELASASLALRHPLVGKKGFAAKGQSVKPPAAWCEGGLVFTSCRYIEKELELRFYECRGKSVRAPITLGINASHAVKCDLRGRVMEELEVADGRIEVSAKPYEIVTIRIKTAARLARACIGVRKC